MNLKWNGIGEKSDVNKNIEALGEKLSGLIRFCLCPDIKLRNILAAHLKRMKDYKAGAKKFLMVNMKILCLELRYMYF